MNYHDNYAIYLRKSRKDLEAEAFGQGETLAKHEKILYELAQREGYHIAEVYKEVVSGDSISDRPEMQRLLQDIYKGKYKGVLVVELERLARGDVKDQGTVSEAFKYSNTLIITPQKIYNPHDEFDEEFFEFGLFMSRREYKTIKRRLMTARQKVVEDGNWIGTIAPYGYNQKRIDRRNKTLIPNEEAQYIKLIFKWFTEDRLTVGEIARQLTAMGVPTRTGKSVAWNRATITSILKNDAYRGKIRWKHRHVVKGFEDGEIVKRTKRLNRDECILVDGKHEPLIDDDTFFKAQELFNTSTHTVKKYTLSNPLAGLLYCSECGKAMVYQANKGKSKSKEGARPRIVHAFGHKCITRSCAFEEIYLPIIEKLKEELANYEFRLEGQSLEDDIKHYEMMLAEFEGTIKELKKRRLDAFDKLDRKIFTEYEFMEYKEHINAKIAETESAMNRLVKPQQSEYEERAYTLHKVIDSMTDDRISARDKNNLLKSVIERIDYSKEKEEISLVIKYKPASN